MKHPTWWNQATEKQLNYINGLQRKLKWTHQDMLEHASKVADRSIYKENDISKSEASALIGYMKELLGEND